LSSEIFVVLDDHAARREDGRVGIGEEPAALTVDDGLVQQDADASDDQDLGAAGEAGVFEDAQAIAGLDFNCAHRELRASV
jgi:hypothetical protein